MGYCSACGGFTDFDSDVCPECHAAEMVTASGGIIKDDSGAESERVEFVYYGADIDRDYSVRNPSMFLDPVDSDGEMEFD